MRKRWILIGINKFFFKMLCLLLWFMLLLFGVLSRVCILERGIVNSEYKFYGLNSLFEIFIFYLVFC